MTIEVMTNDPTIVRTYHEVTLSPHAPYPITKEVISLACETTWRGQVVTVEMNIDRYQYHGTNGQGFLSPWRCYATNARFGTWEERGGSTTDLARSRLSTELSPVALAWLETDTYTTSRNDAIFHAIKRLATYDLNEYNISWLRDTVLVYAVALGGERYGRLLKVADAFTAYNHAIRECV